MPTGPSGPRLAFPADSPSFISHPGCSVALSPQPGSAPTRLPPASPRMEPRPLQGLTQAGSLGSARPGFRAQVWPGHPTCPQVALGQASVFHLGGTFQPRPPIPTPRATADPRLSHPSQALTHSTSRPASRVRGSRGLGTCLPSAQGSEQHLRQACALVPSLSPYPLPQGPRVPVGWACLAHPLVALLGLSPAIAGCRAPCALAPAGQGQPPLQSVGPRDIRAGGGSQGPAGARAGSSARGW